jgi:hypothetical protein
MQVQDSCHCVWWAVAPGANENGAMLLQLHVQVLDSAGAAAHGQLPLYVVGCCTMCQ